MQGVGMDDIIKYKLNTLSEKQQSDLAGNSLPPQLFETNAVTIANCWLKECI